MSRSNSDQVNTRLGNKKVKSDLHQTEVKLVRKINVYNCNDLNDTLKFKV